MKKAEKILIGMAILALGLKTFHLPLGGILITLSLSILSILYLYLSFAFFNNIRLRNILKKESYKNASKGRIIGAIGTGIALSITLIGLLFKLQLWPGAHLQLMVGGIGLGIVLFISLVNTRGNLDSYYSKILKRVMFFGAICLFLLILPTKSWLTWNYPDNPEYVEALIEAQENPNNQELQEKAEQEREKMRDNLNK